MNSLLLLIDVLSLFDSWNNLFICELKELLLFFKIRFEVLVMVSLTYGNRGCVKMVIEKVISSIVGSGCSFNLSYLFPLYITMILTPLFL